MDHITNGGRLERDELVPESIYDNIMIPCFERDPQKRIRMSDVRVILHL